MRSFIALALVLFIAPAPEASSQQRPVLSPRDSVTLTLDTNRITVNYGRPSMRGRVIMGELVPWDKVWRTGANQATRLATNSDMVMGGVPVPRGSYTLYTLPSSSGWKIIVNKQTGQWGTVYNAGQDLARFDAQVETLPTPVDTFTIAFTGTGTSSGLLTLSWEKTRVSAPFSWNKAIRPLSPPDSATVEIGGGHVSVSYSKPFIRGREIWGVVVPFDTLWRTGANAATMLKTDADILIGGTPLAKGSYVVRSIPEAEALTLVLSKPGTSSQDEGPSQEVARVRMTIEKSSTVIDPFRIWFEPAPDRQAALKLGWADRAFTTTVALP